MTNAQLIISILLMALATVITRFVPFLIFGRKGKTPKTIDYLGKVLPSAMMGLLVVYCFRDMNFGEYTELVPAVIGTLTVVVLHIWKRNTILSIVSGTLVYMLVIRLL